jgi:hypothetical protein
MSFGQHVERETARQRGQDGAHLRQHERVLLHVRAAHPLGKAGRRRLRADEIVRRLRAVAHRQRAVGVELAGGAGARDQFVDWNLAQHVARPLRLPHVAVHEPGIGAADFGDRFAGREVHDRINVDAGVRLAPSEALACATYGIPKLGIRD